MVRTEGQENSENGRTKVTVKGYSIRPALIVIDMQNGFVSKDGSYDKIGFDISQYQKIIPAIQRLVSKCRDAGIPIYFTQSVREASGDDLLVNTHKILPQPREERIKETPICIRGTWDGDIVDDILCENSDSIIVKRRDSAFHDTRLDEKLKGMSVDAAIFCGVDTSMCVESSLRDAFNLGYDVIVISDATASMNPKRYECTLDDVRSFYGLVMDSEEFLADITKQ